MRSYYILMIFILVLSMQSCTKDTLDDSFSDHIDISLAQETNLQVANTILFHINSHRQNLSLAPLQFDDTYATAYAVEHTKYMIENNNVNHDFFYKRKNGLKARGAIHVAENVAYGFNSSQSVVNAWLNSPSHKSVIEGNYTHIGIGILTSDNEKFYFTCIFYI